MQFYDNFLRLCNSKGVSPSRAAIETGGYKSDATRWKNGSIPTDARMVRLADYFGVTVADLTDEKDPPPMVGSGNEKIDEIIRIASGLSSEDVEKLIAYAEGIRDAGKEGRE